MSSLFLFLYPALPAVFREGSRPLLISFFVLYSDSLPVPLSVPVESFGVASRARSTTQNLSTWLFGKQVNASRQPPFEVLPPRLFFTDSLIFFSPAFSRLLAPSPFHSPPV